MEGGGDFLVLIILLRLLPVYFQRFVVVSEYFRRIPEH